MIPVSTLYRFRILIPAPDSPAGDRRLSYTVRGRDADEAARCLSHLFPWKEFAGATTWLGLCERVKQAGGSASIHEISSDQGSSS